jgi:D-alanyl-D-alanine carboxypeptidase (penicillin-binding protein 5/6)
MIALVVVYPIGADAAPKTAAPPYPCASFICVEAETGMVLFEHNADAQRAPASMVKMIQMLMVSEQLRGDRWTPESVIPVSRHAQLMGGTQVYLEAGESWPLGHLLTAVSVASANDAAMAIAEGVWGSEEGYLKAMNAQAKAWGMSNSTFTSVHGLPPDKGELPDRTTARDMATLARHCVTDPLVMKLAGTKEFNFRDTDATKYNTNKMLLRMEDCDGIKTGFTRAAGFCVSATAQRNDIRLITVVMGCDNKNERFAFAESLLDRGFAALKRRRLLRAGDLLAKEVSVQNCETESVQLKVTEDLWAVEKRADAAPLDYELDMPQRLRAPLTEGQVVGKVRVVRGDTTLGTVPVVVPANLPVAGWKWKLRQSLLGRKKKEKTS